jgi:hypothetical protein
MKETLMDKHKHALVSGLLCAVLVCLWPAAWAQSPKMKMTTPIPPQITTPDVVETRLGTLRFSNGMPDAATIDKVYDNLDFARAVQTYLNTLRGVSMWAAMKGPRDIGVPDNTLLTMEQMMDSTGMYLTPNTVTATTWLNLDLSGGPLVFEVPPRVLGLVDDAWFRYVTDLGFVGPDKGKGGKYLFLPPGYKGEVPDGYFVVRSPTYKLWAPMRNFAVDGDVKPALESLREHARIYPLSEAGKAHGPVPNKNGSMVQINTIAPNTYQYWEFLNDLVQAEPAGVIGPEITGQMAAIGIVKGKPFQPDARMKAILTEAVAVGNATARAIAFSPREEGIYYYGKAGSGWHTGFLGGYDFLVDGARQLDSRVLFFYQATGITPAMAAKMIGAGSQYAVAAKDSTGQWLDGGKTYKLTLPKDIPQKNFWSVTVYDSQTRSLLQTDQRYPATGAGAGYPAVEGRQKVADNADGSVDIFFGPQPPPGKESNWIQTVPGKGWFTMLRLYSPLEPWFDKTWRPGDIEAIQ